MEEIHIYKSIVSKIDSTDCTISDFPVQYWLVVVVVFFIFGVGGGTGRWDLMGVLLISKIIPLFFSL